LLEDIPVAAAAEDNFFTSFFNSIFNCGRQYHTFILLFLYIFDKILLFFRIYHIDKGKLFQTYDLLLASSATRRRKSNIHYSNL
jgi:hypothetical protein